MVQRSAAALGDGRRLFDGIDTTTIRFERTGVGESPFATRIRYALSGP